jgi:hypothetical protein
MKKEVRIHSRQSMVRTLFDAVYLHAETSAIKECFEVSLALIELADLKSV